jgi:hypothetical protein
MEVFVDYKVEVQFRYGGYVLDEENEETYRDQKEFSAFNPQVSHKDYSEQKTRRQNQQYTDNYVD